MLSIDQQKLLLQQRLMYFVENTVFDKYNFRTLVSLLRYEAFRYQRNIFKYECSEFIIILSWLLKKSCSF